MTPQPNKIEPLVVMNLFWAWWGRWWSPKVSSFHRHQCPETVWALELQCCCQVSALSPKPFHSTSKHQLNFKLTCSLVAEVATGTGHLGSCSLRPVVSPPGCAGGHGPLSSPCWRLDFFLGPGTGGATRPEAAEDGHRALPSHRLQQLLGAHSLTKFDVFMDAYLQLSSMEPPVWGFSVVLQCKY